MPKHEVTAKDIKQRRDNWITIHAYQSCSIPVELKGDIDPWDYVKGTWKGTYDLSLITSVFTPKFTGKKLTKYRFRSVTYSLYTFDVPTYHVTRCKIVFMHLSNRTFVADECPDIVPGDASLRGNVIKLFNEYPEYSNGNAEIQECLTSKMQKYCRTHSLSELPTDEELVELIKPYKLEGINSDIVF